VDTGSSSENAIKQKPRAFSDEVDTGSSSENAIKQKPRAPIRFHWIAKRFRKGPAQCTGILILDSAAGATSQTGQVPPWRRRRRPAVKQISNKKGRARVPGLIVQGLITKLVLQVMANDLSIERLDIP
jgi:hypothetical protein